MNNISLEKTECLPFIKAAMHCALFLVLFVSGCAATQGRGSIQYSPFYFEQDALSYPNELSRAYGYDEQGRWYSRRLNPKPEYTHHCFVVARSAKQFFLHARFDPDLPPADDVTYRQKIRRVTRSSPRYGRCEDNRIVIPGYANLREFSREKEDLMKQESGGAWRSYWQRGHFRMILPFSRRHQERTAESLITSLETVGVTVVHLVQFPRLQINHAAVVFDAEKEDNKIRFDVYDPNVSEEPTFLIYDRFKRRFKFPPNTYFPGGYVNVLEVYSRFW